MSFNPCQSISDRREVRLQYSKYNHSSVFTGETKYTHTQRERERERERRREIEYVRFRAGVRCSLASTEGSCSGTTWPAPGAADIPGPFHHVVPAHVVIIRAV